MKTLRLLRNISAVFILVMALLASRPVAAQAGNKTFCVGKTGFNCGFDSSGNCFETKCAAGQPCDNGGCSNPPKPPKCVFCRPF